MEVPEENTISHHHYWTRKARSKYTKGNLNRNLQLFALLLIFAALPATVYLAKHTQDIRQRASDADNGAAGSAMHAGDTANPALGGSSGTTGSTSTTGGSTGTTNPGGKTDPYANSPAYGAGGGGYGPYGPGAINYYNTSGGGGIPNSAGQNPAMTGNSAAAAAGKAGAQAVQTVEQAIQKTANGNTYGNMFAGTSFSADCQGTCDANSMTINGVTLQTAKSTGIPGHPGLSADQISEIYNNATAVATGYGEGTSPPVGSAYDKNGNLILEGIGGVAVNVGPTSYNGSTFTQSNPNTNGVVFQVSSDHYGPGVLYSNAAGTMLAETDVYTPNDPTLQNTHATLNQFQAADPNSTKTTVNFNGHTGTMYSSISNVTNSAGTAIEFTDNKGNTYFVIASDKGGTSPTNIKNSQELALAEAKGVTPK